MKPVAPLSLSLRPSRRLLLIQSIAHLAAAAAVLAATLPAGMAALLLLLIGASLARLRRAAQVDRLNLLGDGRLEIVSPGGTPIEAIIHPHTLVLSFLVVLRYRQQGRWQSLTLLSDSLAAEDFRQLRLWLRWRAEAPQQA